MEYVFGYLIVVVVYAVVSYIFYARDVYIRAAAEAAAVLRVDTSRLVHVGDIYWSTGWGFACLIAFPLMVFAQTFMPTMLRDRLINFFKDHYIDEFLDENDY